ncbi:MAG: hypothetical protein NVS2B12_20590 [Ktedonobacteraceae bacterium]
MLGDIGPILRGMVWSEYIVGVAASSPGNTILADAGATGADCAGTEFCTSYKVFALTDDC